MSYTLIPVESKEALEKANIHYTRPTLYRYHCEGIMPEIFTKVGRKLFIIKERWDEKVSESIIQTDKRTEKIKELKGE